MASTAKAPDRAPRRGDPPLLPAVIGCVAQACPEDQVLRVVKSGGNDSERTSALIALFVVLDDPRLSNCFDTWDRSAGYFTGVPAWETAIAELKELKAQVNASTITVVAPIDPVLNIPTAVVVLEIGPAFIQQYTCNNEPLNGTARRNMAPKGTWIEVKRFHTHPESKKWTHICIHFDTATKKYCGALIKCYHSAYWNSNEGNKHMLQAYPSSPAALALMASDNTRKAGRRSDLQAAGVESALAKRGGEELEGGARKRAPAKGITQYMHQTKKLTLDKWTDSEFDIFLFYLRFICNVLYKAAFGNPFAQVQHDAGTLADHEKREAIAISFVDPHWSQIHTVALGFGSIASGHDNVLNGEFNRLFPLLLGYEFAQVCSSMVQDRNGMGVADLVGQEKIPCYMHDLSKVPDSALGTLLRSRGGVPVNPCPKILGVLKRLHGTICYYSYGKWLYWLWDQGDRVTGGVCHVHMNPNTSETRPFLSQTFEMHSMFRFNLILRMVLPIYKGACQMEIEDFTIVVEFEGTLHCVHPTVVIVQNESIYIGALAAVCILRVGLALRAPTISVVDLNAVTPLHGTKAKPFVRVDRAVDDFTEIGRDCLERAIIEFERLFCGNTSDVRNNAEFQFNNRESIAVILDIRLVNDTSINPEVKQRGTLLGREDYVEFALTKQAFEADMAEPEPEVVMVDEESDAKAGEEDSEQAGADLPSENLFPDESEAWMQDTPLGALKEKAVSNSFRKSSLWSTGGGDDTKFAIKILIANADFSQRSNNVGST